MNVLDLAQKHVTLKRVSSHKGGEYHGPCPACNGKDRFHVWPAENQGEGSFWCRQCESAGDGIQFLRDFENYSFQGACQYLGKTIDDRPKSGDTPRIPKAIKQTAIPGRTMAPVIAKYTPPPQDPPPGDIWLEKAEAFVAWSQDHLMYIPPTRKSAPADPAAARCRQWLKDRGINEMEMKFRRLGFNIGNKGKDMFRPRSVWDLSPVLKENGTPKKLWLPKGLVIPCIVKGRVTRIRIRRDKDDPRYYVIPGSDMRCTIMKHLPSREAYTIVESELDGILIRNEAGDMTGVIALGNSSRKPDAAAWAALKQAPIILVALDNDKAGHQAARWWREQFPNAKICPIPKGKDPAEAHQAGVNIREWIQSYLPKGWFI
jgi:DNA primase